MQALRHYLLAVQFFTRIPVTGRLAAWIGFDAAMLRAASAHFPGVGWLVGGVACGVYALVWLGLGGAGVAPLVAAVLSTVATVLLTGGFHEDGLADVADGLGGAYQRERALEIMKDSRIGAFGAMALVLALLAKVALLAQLGGSAAGGGGPTGALAALAGAHALSRWWPLCVIYRLPYVSDSSGAKSKPLADSISPAALGAGALWCAPPLLLVWQLLGGLPAACAVVLSAAGALWLHWRFARRLQGFTGDCLGAVQQVSEIAFYLGLALALAP